MPPPLWDHLHIISNKINSDCNLFSRLQRRQYTFHLTLPSMVQQRVPFTVLQRCTSISTTITCQSHARFKCRCRCKVSNRPAASSCSSNSNNSSSNSDHPSTFCYECFPEGVARTSRLCCTGAKVGPAIRYPRPLFVDRTRSSVERRDCQADTWLRNDSRRFVHSVLEFPLQPTAQFQPLRSQDSWYPPKVRNVFIAVYWKKLSRKNGGNVLRRWPWNDEISSVVILGGFRLGNWV